MLRKITAFLESIGVPVRHAQITEQTFVPGITLDRGTIVIDESKLLYPGDLLHEAGHLAVLRPGERVDLQGTAGDSGAFEMAAIGWSWAAAQHLGLDPAIVFHDAGYKGESQALLDNFAAGRFLGVPMLEWLGLTTAATYPAMTSWLRDELGVRRLREFWSRREDVDWVATNTLLCGLGLGLRETYDFLLQQKPSFADFEQWIVRQNGGTIDAERIARLNLALSDHGIAGEPANPAAEPALSPEDLAFWDENGYVVRHEAISPEACAATVRAICGFTGADLEHPDTWYGGPQGHSIWIPLFHDPAVTANRHSARIHRAFAQLWDREDLWATVDQAGFNPPERAGWRFPGPHLHWDVSLARPIPFGVQGILYLTDTAANQGAFSCVPGFHKKIDQWLGSLPDGVDPRQQDFSKEAIPITGRAGDLVIWHHALPHGSSPNSATVPRFAQYIFMRPSRWEYRTEWL